MIIKKLKLQNFKGTKQLTLEFDAKINDIYGKNRSGKTTICDAFSWLFFNKNSQGNTEDIKTLDIDGNIINNLEHVVEAVITIDDEDINIKKLHQQKWTKKRGVKEPILEGSENKYFWNDVPLKEKEFNAKIESIISLDNMLLLSNPYRFNEGIDWKKRRDILFEKAGNIDDNEIFNKNKDLLTLQEVLKKKTLNEYKKEILAKKSNLKKELESISPRIEEVNRSIIIIEKPDIEDNIYERIKSIDEQINHTSQIEKAKQDQMIELIKEINDRKRMLLEEKNNYNSESSKKKHEFSMRNQNNKNDISKIEQSIAFIQSEISRIEKDLALQNQKLVDLRALSRKEKAETFLFDESLCICPTCKQELPHDDVENKKSELESNFNSEKIKRLEKIKNDGINCKLQVENMQNQLDDLNASYAAENIKLNELTELSVSLEKESLVFLNDVAFEETERCIELLNEIKLLEQKEHRLQDVNDNKLRNKLISEKAELEKKIKLLDQYNYHIQSNVAAGERIAELKQSENKLALAFNELEHVEYLIEEFTREKVNLIEDKINNKFKMAKFKMFHRQANGGIAETCETLYNGVPYSQLNDEAKLNVGLDIINTLNEYYGIDVPIFIDNRESIESIIDVNSQIINFRVPSTPFEPQGYLFKLG